MAFLAIVGTAGYDAISLAGTHVTVAQEAQEAAQVGQDVLARPGTARAASAAVLEYCEQHQDTLVAESLVIDTAHRTVTLTLSREAHTIVSSYLPRVKNY